MKDEFISSLWSILGLIILRVINLLQKNLSYLNVIANRVLVLLKLLRPSLTPCIQRLVRGSPSIRAAEQLQCRAVLGERLVRGPPPTDLLINDEGDQPQAGGGSRGEPDPAVPAQRDAHGSGRHARVRSHSRTAFGRADITV